MTFPLKMSERKSKIKETKKEWKEIQEGIEEWQRQKKQKQKDS